MALMGSHDKNYKFFMIFGPLAWLVRLREAFSGLCYDFQGGGYLGGIDKMNFWFLAKIHLFAWYNGVWVQKVPNFLLQTHFNTQI